jgi:hypothetical protein
VLTYARRYALFTLVGIAGEDDLDAPDLLTPTQNGPDIATPPDPGRGRLNGGQHKGGQKGAIAKGGQAGSSSAAAPLGTEASAALCDGLVAELNALQGGEDAALWAFRSLSDKSRLTAADAQRLGEAFQARLPGFAAHSEDDVATPECTAQLPPPVPARDEAAAISAPAIARPKRLTRKPKLRSRSPGIDKTVLA